MTELIKPNLHNVLVHYPVALVSLGAVIELLSFLYRRHSLRAAGRWMIFLGVLAMLPALSTGLYAARQSFHAEAGLKWAEVKTQAPLTEAQWELLRRHISANAVATGILIIMVLVYVGSSDLWRRRLYFVHLLLLLGGLGVMTIGAHHGGLMVYEGVGTKAMAQSVHIEELQADDSEKLCRRIERNFPPLEVHLIFAGFTLAMTMAALAMSCRRCSDYNTAEHVVDKDIADALVARSIGTFGVEGGEARTPRIDTVVATPVPAARFWMLASLLGLLAALTGWWSHGNFNWREAWDYVRDVENKRVFFHVIFGASLIVLPWILALFARFAPRARIFLLVLTLCVLAIAAVQVWLGILLLFDSGNGPLNGFN